MATAKTPLDPCLFYLRPNPAQDGTSIIVAVQPHNGDDLDQYELDSERAFNLAVDILNRIKLTLDDN